MAHGSMVWAQPSPPNNHHNGPSSLAHMDVDLATLSLAQHHRAHLDTHEQDSRRPRHRSQTVAVASVPVFSFTPSETHTVGPASKHHLSGTQQGDLQNPHSLADPKAFAYRLRAHTFSPAGQFELDGGFTADTDNWGQHAPSTQHYAPHRPSVLGIPGHRFACSRSGSQARLLSAELQSRSADDLIALTSFDHTQASVDQHQPPIASARPADNQHLGESFFPATGEVDTHGLAPVSRTRALTSADVLFGSREDFAPQSNHFGGPRPVHITRARGNTVSGPLRLAHQSSTQLAQTASAEDFLCGGIGCPTDRFDQTYRQPGETRESLWEGSGALPRGRLSSESAATGLTRSPAPCGGQPCSVNVGFVHSVPLAQFEQGLSRAGNASRSMQVLALVYRSRALRSRRGLCRHCLLLGCLVLADKYLHDVAVPMAQWATWAGLPVQQVCGAERHVLWVLDFELYVPQDEFNGWVLCFLQLHYRSALQAATASPAPTVPTGPRSAVRTLSDSPLGHRSGPVRAHGLASRSQLLASPSRRHTPLPTRPYPLAGANVGRRSVSVAPGQGRVAFAAEVEAIAKLLRSDCTVADTPPHPFAQQPHAWPQTPVDFGSPAYPTGGY